MNNPTSTSVRSEGKYQFCYMIQTYKSPSQILRLINVILRLSPQCFVIVSHDRNGADLPMDTINKLKRVHVLFSDGARGDFNTVERYMDVVKWLWDNNILFDWLVNITGQDYPLRPLCQIEDEVINSGTDGIINNYFRVFLDESPWGIRDGKTRYLFRYNRPSKAGAATTLLFRILSLANRCQPLVRFSVSFGPAFGFRTRSPFSSDFHCFGGSFYCILNAASVRYLYEYLTNHTQFVEYLKHTLVPEEIVIQTVLLNSGQFKLSKTNLRFYDFAGSTHGSPRVLGSEDLPAMIGSGRAFARKFDISQDSSVLSELDRILGVEHAR